MTVRSGAGDGRERLIPLVPDFVLTVDARGRKIRVEWDRRRCLTPLEPSRRAPAITFEVVTLFPEVFDGIPRATCSARRSRRASSPCTAPTRATSASAATAQVDDTPYGGGPGMILRVEPIAAALEAIAAARGPSRRILLTPQGRACSTRRRARRAGGGRSR